MTDANIPTHGKPLVEALYGTPKNTRVADAPLSKDAIAEMQKAANREGFDPAKSEIYQNLKDLLHVGPNPSVGGDRVDYVNLREMAAEAAALGSRIAGKQKKPPMPAPRPPASRQLADVASRVAPSIVAATTEVRPVPAPKKRPALASIASCLD